MRLPVLFAAVVLIPSAAFASEPPPEVMKVAADYLRQHNRIDGSGSVEEVSSRVQSALSPKLAQRV